MSLSNIRELFSKRVTDSQKLEEPNAKNVFSLESVPKEDFGITEFLRKDDGFVGIIKHRYSDFQVREIDKDGNVIRLTTTELPEIKKDEEFEELDVNITEDINCLLGNGKEAVEIDVTPKNKDERRSLHKSIKGKFGKKVVSNTITEGEVCKIVVKKNNCVNRERWEDGIPKFLHFVLCKSNEDTADVIHLLASKLKINPSLISYAGTKDKRGETTQQMCIKQVLPNRLKSLNGKLHSIKTGNYCFKHEPLKLGDLCGNFFQIAIRNLQVNDDVIINAVKEVKEKGFINYFGLQRFGNSPTTPTHEIGKAIIKKEYRKAIELILKPRYETFPDLSSARNIWWEKRNPKQAYSVLNKKKNSIEGKILLALSKNGENNFVGALCSLQRNSRLLYIHAYQSYIWNKLVSKRIREYGLIVLLGDLVVEKGNVMEFGSEVEDVIPGEEEKKESADRNKNIEIVTDDNINNYTIFDVVLPLPGHSIKYPDNIIESWYKEILSEDELGLTSFTSKDLKFSLPGNYRKILGNISDLKYNIITYLEPDETLICSDVNSTNGTPVKTENAPLKALILEFSLDTCSYATMVLREIMKIDTAAEFHKKLNVGHLKRSINEEDSIDKQTKVFKSDVIQE